LVFVRPGELRKAQWPEIDFDKAEWRIPAARIQQFAAEIIQIAEDFAAAEPGGDTVYGLIAGVYPTDRPSLKEDDE